MVGSTLSFLIFIYIYPLWKGLKQEGKELRPHLNLIQNTCEKLLARKELK